MISGFKRWDLAVAYAIEGETIKSMCARAGVDCESPMRCAIRLGMIPPGSSRTKVLRSTISERVRRLRRAMHSVALDLLWKKKPRLLDRHPRKSVPKTEFTLKHGVVLDDVRDDRRR